VNYGRTIVAMLFSVTVATLVWGAPAAAAPPAGGEYCNVVVRKLQPGQQVSDVVSRDCDTDPAALARRAPQAETLLSQLYEHAGWKGEFSNIFGYDGPCDHAGYGFSTRFENVAVRGISSYFVFNSCWSTTAYNNNNGANKAFCWDVSYVTDALNDHVHRLELARPYPGAC
jgi:hypothetical protein